MRGAPKNSQTKMISPSTEKKPSGEISNGDAVMRSPSIFEPFSTRKYGQSLSLFWITSILLLSGGRLQLNEVMAAPLSLEQYLREVSGQHQGYQAAQTRARGALARSDEGTLLLAPTAFAELRSITDAKLQPVTYFTYDSMVTNTLSVGVRKLFSFGLQTSLHYDLFKNYYNNLESFLPANLFPPSPNSSGSLVLNSYAYASPVLELTQSLWGNAFGSGTRAQQNQLHASALATHYQESFEAKSVRLAAESAYWRLSLARQTLRAQREALARALRIQHLLEGQAHYALKDQADVIQAKAQVALRRLQGQSAQVEEDIAARAFNSYRSLDSSGVQETLSELGPLVVESVHAPVRMSVREDLQALEQTAEAAVASAQLAIEKNKPTVEVFANLSLIGQKGPLPFGNLSDSYATSFTFNRPSRTVGIRLSVPLDFGVLGTTRHGWAQEKTAAEIKLNRQSFEQNQQWRTLETQLAGAQAQYRLNRQLVSVQRDKLRYERNRLSRGRTTTYQVLMFEQDYLDAELAEIQTGAAILNWVAQMRLFAAQEGA